MMKKKICQIIVILLFCGLLFGICPVPEPCPVPFVHDKDAITYRSVGSYTMTLSQTIVHDFNSCDPDEDNGGFIYELLSGPAGMACTTEGKLTYHPLGVGIFFADVKVTDMPIVPDQYLSDYGTIVFRVLPDNRPPVLGGCRQ